MKKSLTLFLLVLSHFIHGQVFEGSVRFRLRYNETENDGALKPAFNEYLFRGPDMIIKLLDKENKVITWVLVKGGDRSVYMLDDSARLAMKMSWSEDLQVIGNVPREYEDTYNKALEEARSDRAAEAFGMIDTGEKMKIAGYDCTKFEVGSMDTGGKTYAWLTEGIRVTMPLDIPGDPSAFMGLMTKQGFPLKVVFYFNDKEESLSMEAEKVSVETLNDDMFKVPEGYTISDLSNLMR